MSMARASSHNLILFGLPVIPYTHRQEEGLGLSLVDFIIQVGLLILQAAQ